jgi:hypothetical protein
MYVNVIELCYLLTCSSVREASINGGIFTHWMGKTALSQQRERLAKHIVDSLQTQLLDLQNNIEDINLDLYNMLQKSSRQRERLSDKPKILTSNHDSILNDNNSKMNTPEFDRSRGISFSFLSSFSIGNISFDNESLGSIGKCTSAAFLGPPTKVSDENGSKVNFQLIGANDAGVICYWDYTHKENQDKVLTSIFMFVKNCI